MSSPVAGLMLGGLLFTGAYLLISARQRTPATSYTSTTGIVATNFAKTSSGALTEGGTLQGIAWSRSDGSNEDYARKLKEVYDEAFGTGRW